jgi:hypothetical protein
MAAAEWQWQSDAQGGRVVFKAKVGALARVAAQRRRRMLSRGMGRKGDSSGALAGRAARPSVVADLTRARRAVAAPGGGPGQVGGAGQAVCNQGRAGQVRWRPYSSARRSRLSASESAARMASTAARISASDWRAAGGTRSQ